MAEFLAYSVTPPHSQLAGKILQGHACRLGTGQFTDGLHSHYLLLRREDWAAVTCHREDQTVDHPLFYPRRGRV